MATPAQQHEAAPEGRKILIRFGGGTMRAWLPAGVTPASIKVREVGAPTAATQSREVR